jgi:starch phosphorylase
MKAAANGALNVSTPDGWWEEVWQDFGRGSEPVGWTIGRGESYSDNNYQDEVESDALYELLEKEVVPTFYDRKGNGLPRHWITYMKHSIGTLCHFYNAHRMTQEYTEQLYLPTHHRYHRLAADGYSKAKSLAAWKKVVREAWSEVRIENLDTDPQMETELAIGDEIHARARVHLGSLNPEDVSVQLFLGQLGTGGEIVEAEAVPMYLVGSGEKGAHEYESREVRCTKSGLQGYTLRVLPNHPDLATPFLPGLVAWAKS